MKNLEALAKALLSEMKRYVDPNNKDGFAKAYFSWIVENWSKCEFFDTEIIDSGYDVSFMPVRTGKLLSEEIETLEDFLDANTGNYYATYCSGSGMACETISLRATEFFRELCVNEIEGLVFLLGNGIVIPEDYQDDAESVSHLFISDIIDSKKHPELSLVSEEIYNQYTGSTWSFDEIYSGKRYLEMTLDECRDVLNFYIK